MACNTCIYSLAALEGGGVDAFPWVMSGVCRAVGRICFPVFPASRGACIPGPCAPNSVLAPLSRLLLPRWTDPVTMWAVR